MKIKPPSVPEWKDLYDAAVEFKKIGCWDWMLDNDIFGVKNPATGEVGYCCVMGRLGEHFALSVYLGAEGLEGHFKMRSGISTSQSGFDMLQSQKCLMASFEDRNFLTEEDIKVIKMLGLKFRGSNSWPLFRNYLPGYYPWYINSEEAKYLTLALRQAIEVSLRFRDDPKMLTPKKGDQYLVRVPEKEKEDFVWRDEWISQPKPEKKEFIPEPVDAKRMEKIRGMISRRRGIWEIDFSYFPGPVKDNDERPYYPYAILWVEKNSGMILNAHITNAAGYRSEFVEQFFKLAEGIECLPLEILVKREEAFKLLEPVASGLGIKLREVKNLTVLEEARESMFESM